MRWLAENWHALAGLAGMVAGIASWIAHNLGHVKHELVIDDIANYLNKLSNGLNQQKLTTPQLPETLKNPSE